MSRKKSEKDLVAEAKLHLVQMREGVPPCESDHHTQLDEAIRARNFRPHSDFEPGYFDEWRE